MLVAFVAAAAALVAPVAAMFVTLVAILVAFVAAAAAFVAPVAAMFVVFVVIAAAFVAPVAAMFVTLVAMLVAFVAAAAALVAPVATMFVTLVAMLVAFVAAAAAFVAPVDAILVALVTVKPDTMLISPVADVACVVLSPKINDLEDARLIFSVECQASVASNQVHFLSLSVDFTTIPPSFTAESFPIGVPLLEANSNCLSAIVTVVLSR